MSAATAMAIGTAVSRATGFVRTSVWAAAIGLNIVGATFLVANTIPTVLYTLVAGGAINAVLVPQLVRAFALPEREGREYTDKILSATIILLAAVTLAAVALAPAIVTLYSGNGWSDHDRRLAVVFAYCCLPQIFFYGAFTILGQVGNARGSFGPMTWAPVVNNVISIGLGLALLTFATIDTDAIAAGRSTISTPTALTLGLGSTLGIVAQSLVLVLPLRRSGFRFRMRLSLRGAGLRRVGGVASWMLLFVAANQVAYLVTTVTANTAGRVASGGGMPTYSNAYLIWLLPHGVVVVSVVTSRFPQMARAFSTGRAREAGRLLLDSIRLVGAVSVVVATVFLVLGTSFTRMVFPGNDPTEADQIGGVLMAFAPALPFFAVQYVLLRWYYVREETRTPALLQILIAAVNISTSLLVAGVVRPRDVVVWLAVGYGVAYAIGALVTGALVRRSTEVPGLGRETLRLLGLAAALTPATAAGILVQRAVSDDLGPSVTGSLLTIVTAGATYAALAAYPVMCAARYLRHPVRQVNGPELPGTRRRLLRRSRRAGRPAGRRR